MTTLKDRIEELEKENKEMRVALGSIAGKFDAFMPPEEAIVLRNRVQELEVAYSSLSSSYEKLEVAYEKLKREHYDRL